MKKATLRKPFLVINPKAYLYGDEILNLAKHADALAEKHDIDILFTAQFTDLAILAKQTKHLFLTAQHMDGMEVGKGMGHILPEALRYAGVQAVFLNHAEHPLSLHALAKAIQRSHDVGILSVVCADTVEEAKALAMLHPDVMVCEQTSLIGTGKVSDASYMCASNEAVKSVSPNTLVLQAAGISSGKDVYDAIMSGADGSGGTSGIVCAKDPYAVVEDMIEALVKVRSMENGGQTHDDL